MLRLSRPIRNHSSSPNLGGQKEQLVIRNIDLYAIACNFGCVLGGSVVASFSFFLPFESYRASHIL